MVEKIDLHAPNFHSSFLCQIFLRIILVKCLYEVGFKKYIYTIQICTVHFYVKLFLEINLGNPYMGWDLKNRPIRSKFSQFIFKSNCFYGLIWGHESTLNVIVNTWPFIFLLGSIIHVKPALRSSLLYF